MYKPCSPCRRCSCAQKPQSFATTERSCKTSLEAGHAPAAPRLPGLRAAGSLPDMLSQTTGAESRLSAMSRCSCTRHAGSCRVRVRRRPSNQGLSRVFRKPESASARHAVPRKDMLDVHMYMLCLLAVAERRARRRKPFPASEEIVSPLGAWSFPAPLPPLERARPGGCLLTWQSAPRVSCTPAVPSLARRYVFCCPAPCHATQ